MITHLDIANILSNLNAHRVRRRQCTTRVVKSQGLQCRSACQLAVESQIVHVTKLLASSSLVNDAVIIGVNQLNVTPVQASKSRTRRSVVVTLNTSAQGACVDSLQNDTLNLSSAQTQSVSAACGVAPAASPGRKRRACYRTR